MYSIQCLGIGRGATNFRTGEPSSAYVLKQSGRPILLLDCGAGVGRSAVALLEGDLPDTVYISHNHSDHTGDLPLFLATRKDKDISLLGHQNILDIVREHRLHEVPSIGVDRDADLTWVSANEQSRIALDALELALFRTLHAYECYGFSLFDGDKPILGWTADCPFDQDVYDTVSQAKTAILHGCPSPSGDHASFDEIETYARTAPETQFYVSHYEKTDYSFSAPNVTLLKTGDELTLA